MATVSVRYIVDDVDAAVAFYCEQLGFHEQMHPAPTFAMLTRGALRLVLSAPGGGPGGGQSMPDGTLPRPGGWNRFSIEVDDLEGMVSRLRAAGARFRNEIVTGVGGKQILVEDPSGNPVELFEPTRPEARLADADAAPSRGRAQSGRADAGLDATQSGRPASRQDRRRRGRPAAGRTAPVQRRDRRRAGASSCGLSRSNRSCSAVSKDSPWVAVRLR